MTKRFKVRSASTGLRWASTFAWTVVVTVWHFSLLVNLTAMGAEYEGMLPMASIVARSLDRLWLIASFGGLAVGMVWHAYMLVLASRFDPRPVPGWARIQLVGAACITVGVAPLMLRIPQIVTSCGLSFAGHSAPMALWYYGRPVPAQRIDVLPLMVAISGMVAGVVFLQTTLVIRRMRPSDRPVAGFLALLACLLLVSVDRDYAWASSASPNVLRNLAGLDAERRALFTDDLIGPESRGWLRLHLATHDGTGRFVPEARLYRRDFDDPCDVCQLPVSRFFAIEGLVLQIVDAPIDTEQPARVVEIPRGGGTFRLYDARASSWETGSIGEIGELRLPDWIVLKMDTRLWVGDVRAVLGGLRRAGVARVSLAVRPLEWPLAPPPGPIHLRQSADEGAEPFEAVRGEEPHVIIVKKYVGPESYGPPWPACEQALYDEGVRLVAAPAAGSVPRSVYLAGLERDATYQDVLDHLEQAVAGGARQVGLVESRR